MADDKGMAYFAVVIREVDGVCSWFSTWLCVLFQRFSFRYVSCYHEVAREIWRLQFYLLGITEVNIFSTTGFLGTAQIFYPNSCNYSEMHLNANSCLSLWNAVLILRRARWQYVLNNLEGGGENSF